MARLNWHPAPGFGDLMAGSFVVPQNPLRPGDTGTPLVPCLQATAPGQVLRIARLAELMPGQFTVPQNPLRDALMGGMSGLGCGCSSGCGNSNYTLNGMGDLSMDSMTSWLTDPSPISASVPNWMLYGGAAVALWFITQPSGREYRSKRKALRSEYAGYKQAARSTGSAISSIG